MHASRRSDVIGTIGTIVALDGAVQLVPGARRTIGFALERAVGVEPGMRFALREGGKTIGAGVVTSVS